MNLQCIRCAADFEAITFRGYCDACLRHFGVDRVKICKAQRSAPGPPADGKFSQDEGPKSLPDPVSLLDVCGLCGSEELSPGYGLGSGRGIGSYTYCENCHAFLNFVEDME